MTRAIINATLLLLCVSALSACAKEGKKSSRVRVSAQTRLAKTAQEKAQAEREAAEAQGQQVDLTAPCIIDSQESCGAVRASVAQDGDLEFTSNKMTTNTQLPVKLGDGGGLVTKTTDKDQVTYVIKQKLENKGKKLMVISASQAESAPLNKLFEEAKLSFSNIEVSKYVLNENKDAAAAAKRFDIKADQEILIVVLAGSENVAKQVETVIKKAQNQAPVKTKVSTLVLPQAANGYMIENSALQIVGSNINLQFVLPEQEDAFDPNTVTLAVNDNLAKRDSDFFLVATPEGAIVQIRKPSILKNISDTVTIKYNLKKAPEAKKDDVKPADTKPAVVETKPAAADSSSEMETEETQE